MSAAKRKGRNLDESPALRALLEARQKAVENHLQKQQRAVYTIGGLLTCVLNSIETEDNYDDACLSLRHISKLMEDLSIGLDSVTLHKALGIEVKMPEGAQL
jgi:hypothetical protein